MKTTLAENIRAFRKERKLTQEQLAEALGVTVGAVSKWESGATTPDISLIIGLAGFFETSVDVLLGYDWKRGGMGQAAEHIKALRNAKRFDEAIAEAEKALKKYPNAFDIAFRAAQLFAMAGMELDSQKMSAKALAQFERSLELIEQNENEKINEWSINNNIADVYQSLGQTDKAVELMKRNNAAGLNDDSIGLILSKTKPDEALPYLSDALVVTLMKLFRISIGLSRVFYAKGDTESMLGVQLWMAGVIDGMRVPGRVSHLDKELSVLMAACAATAAELGRPEAAREYLERAEAAAGLFDAAPNYGFTAMRFFNGDANITAFDDMGATAYDGVKLIMCGPDAAEAAGAVWRALHGEA